MRSYYYPAIRLRAHRNNYWMVKRTLDTCAREQQVYHLFTKGGLIFSIYQSVFEFLHFQPLLSALSIACAASLYLRIF